MHNMKSFAISVVPFPDYSSWIKCFCRCRLWQDWTLCWFEVPLMEQRQFKTGVLLPWNSTFICLEQSAFMGAVSVQTSFGISFLYFGSYWRGFFYFFFIFFYLYKSSKAFSEGVTCLVRFIIGNAVNETVHYY